MLSKNRLSLALMVNVIVILEIDPLKIDEFLAVILENAAASRLEPGCIRFEVSRDNEQSNLFALSESYVDQAAFDLHYTTPHVAKWRASGPGFVLKRWAVKGPVF